MKSIVKSHPEVHVEFFYKAGYDDHSMIVIYLDISRLVQFPSIQQAGSVVSFPCAPKQLSLEVSFVEAALVNNLSTPVHCWQTFLIPVPHDPETVAVSP